MMPRLPRATAIALPYLLSGCLLLFGPLALSGCLMVSAAGTFGPVLDADVIGQIKPGETTKGEVLALLGPPEEFLRSEVVESLADETTRVSGAISLGNRAQDAFSWQRDQLVGTGHVLLVYNRFVANVESDLLVVFFDEQDRVREVSYRAGQKR